MKKNIFFIPGYFLTNTAQSQLFFLLLAISTLYVPCSICRAANNVSDESNPLYSSTQAFSPIDDTEQHERAAALLRYIRQQNFNLLPGLPSAVHNPSGWVLNRLQSVQHGLGLEDEDVSTVVEPVSDLATVPSPEMGEAAWLSPSYHHYNGFSPFHDAFIAAFTTRQSFLNRQIKMELRPFYGQNLTSTRNYWGSEIALNLDSTLGLIKPGKISFSYINGDPYLLDHGHGLNLHGELQFTEQLSFNTGVRQGSNQSQMGDYALLRWRLAFPSD